MEGNVGNLALSKVEDFLTPVMSPNDWDPVIPGLEDIPIQGLSLEVGIPLIVPASGK